MYFRHIEINVYIFFNNVVHNDIVGSFYTNCNKNLCIFCTISKEKISSKKYMFLCVKINEINQFTTSEQHMMYFN